MMQTNTPARRRSAFTLIELLVVISIIAILVSLLMAAVFRALLVVKDVQNRSDISQLASAIASFKQTFGVDYMPSKFDPADAEIQFFMSSRCFPQTTPAYWNGVPVMEGDQCLVFFLGGVNGTGFSSNPKDPLAAPTAGEVRKGPFFDFKTSRLKVVHGTSPSYIDIYGQKPFAYFSTRGTANSYTADCAGIGAAHYTNVMPDSFQIISAGVNMQWGPGGVWNPATIGAAGRDDLANFATAKLGSSN